MKIECLNIKMIRGKQSGFNPAGCKGWKPFKFKGFYEFMSTIKVGTKIALYNSTADKKEGGYRGGILSSFEGIEKR